jgi:hypothetical protein
MWTHGGLDSTQVEAVSMSRYEVRVRFNATDDEAARRFQQVIEEQVDRHFLPRTLWEVDAPRRLATAYSECLEREGKPAALPEQTKGETP